MISTSDEKENLNGKEILNYLNEEINIEISGTKELSSLKINPERITVDNVKFKKIDNLVNLFYEVDLHITNSKKITLQNNMLLSNSQEKNALIYIEKDIVEKYVY